MVVHMPYQMFVDHSPTSTVRIAASSKGDVKKAWAALMLWENYFAVETL